MTLVQIVPAGSGGVRDFATSLQSQWSRSGWPSSIIELTNDSIATAPLRHQLNRIDVAFGRPVAVLLHFSAYGYGARGLCGWLAREVAAARDQLGSRMRLVTFFHELSAGGLPWRSAFWLGPLQGHSAQRLAQLSDEVATNTERHARWLGARVRRATPIKATPVFSGIGEAADPPQAAERSADMVLFGAAATRERAWKLLLRCPTQLTTLGVHNVTEIGPGSAVGHMLGTIAHRHLGAVDATSVVQALRQHRFALIDYPSVHLGKSSVFAAYAAHGCVVLNTAPPGPDTDGLAAGRHYVNLRGHADQRLDMQHLQSVADALQAWYRTHTLTSQADSLAALLCAIN